MSHKLSFEVLELVLQDLRHNPRPMGGATVLLAGGFRQIIPVVPEETAADGVNTSIKLSYRWSGLQKLRLTTDMRVQVSGNDASRTFTRWRVGRIVSA